MLFSITLMSCTTRYLTSNPPKVYKNKSNFLYFYNDSLKSTYELIFTNFFFEKDSIIPFLFDKTNRYILNAIKLDSKKDIILFSDSHQMIVLRYKTFKLNDYVPYDVFDSTDCNCRYYIPKPTIFFHRKTRINYKRRLYFIEDVFKVKQGYVSFIYFGQNDKTGGSWTINPIDPDDICFYKGFYKYSIEVTRRNLKKIIQNNNEL